MQFLNAVCYYLKLLKKVLNADVAELADAPDLGSGAARRGGSSPPWLTNRILLKAPKLRGFFRENYVCLPSANSP